jgi:hypothetical protein
MNPRRSDNSFDSDDRHTEVDALRQSRHLYAPTPAHARAIAEAMRRPPLRIAMRHEPHDRVDAYPTFDLTPCSSATALTVLDRVMRDAGTSVLIEGAKMILAGKSALTYAEREALRDSVVGNSLTVDVPGAIALTRATAERVTVARIDGPVDISDTCALEAAVSSGATPLDADLRTTAVLQLGGECSRWMPVWAQFRDCAAAKRFAARMLLLYVARVTGRPAGSIPTIHPDALRLPTSGFTVRPQEIRTDGVTIVVPVRTVSGRRTVNLTLDCTTERWYA